MTAKKTTKKPKVIKFSRPQPPKKTRVVGEGRVTVYGRTSYGTGPWQDGSPIKALDRLVIIGSLEIERLFLTTMNRPKFTGQKVRITIEEI